MQQALLHKRLPILATTARDIHKKVIVGISLSEPIRVTPHDSLTNDGNVMSLLVVSQFGGETDSVFKSPMLWARICTLHDAIYIKLHCITFMTVSHQVP